MLRASELGIAISDLDLLSIGMVLDMCTEKTNDYCDEDIREATAEEIENF